MRGEGSSSSSAGEQRGPECRLCAHSLFLLLPPCDLPSLLEASSHPVKIHLGRSLPGSWHIIVAQVNVGGTELHAGHKVMGGNGLSVNSVQRQGTCGWVPPRDQVPAVDGAPPS